MDWFRRCLSISLSCLLILSSPSLIHISSHKYLAPTSKMQKDSSFLEKVSPIKKSVFSKGGNLYRAIKNWSLRKKLAVSSLMLTVAFMFALAFGFVFYKTYTIGVLTGVKYKLLSFFLSPTEKNIRKYSAEIQEIIKSKDTWYEITIFNVVELRRDLIERSGFSKEKIAKILGMSPIKKEIYLQHNVIVDGASETELKTVKDFLDVCPRHHVDGLHSIVIGVEHEGAIGRYSPIYKKGIITTNGCQKGKGLKDLLAHEMGHKVWFQNMTLKQKIYFSRLHNSSNRGEKFVSDYSKTDCWEDYAEMHWKWMENSKKILDDSKGVILKKKFEAVAQQFEFRKNQHLYLRGYENFKLFDLLIERGDQLVVAQKKKRKNKSIELKISVPFSFIKKKLGLNKEEDGVFVPAIQFHPLDRLFQEAS